MTVSPPQIPPLFLNKFQVDSTKPFERYLNRLEVDVGQEDYRELLRVERLKQALPDARYDGMVELTDRLLQTTQNRYNQQLLQQMGVRIYLDEAAYRIYYRLPEGGFRFIPVWREGVLKQFLKQMPTAATDWVPCASELPGFECRYLPDEAGGTLLFRREAGVDPAHPLMTVAHGPYDPHTLEVLLYFLRSGKTSSAVVNLGYSGREPLTDANVTRLAEWNCPLNPSNLDVIFPYTDAKGLPHSYKTERHLRASIEALEMDLPPLVMDIHGCVGTGPDDQRLIVGLGGMPPYPRLEDFGSLMQRGSLLHLNPFDRLRQGLGLLRDLSDEFYVQFCTDAQQGYHFFVLGKLQLMGRAVDLRAEVSSLLDGEERTYLPGEQIRWLPGAGANALQRVEVSLLDPEIQCLHVEIPTYVRRKIRLRLKEMAIDDSFDSSSL